MMDTVRILLVEDEPRVSQALCRALSLANPTYTVVHCASGEEALVQLETSVFDLLVTDLRMPGMSGLQLLEQARTLNPEMRGLLITAFGSPQVASMALRLANGYLPKPFSIKTLTHAVHQALKAPLSKKPSVLILEDDEDLRRLFGKTLGHAGYDVVQAATIQAAEQMLEQQSFDVFLCDIYINNEQSTRLIREHSTLLTTNNTQVILISGEAQYREICTDLGIDFFLDKPVSLGSLVTLVNRVVPQE